MEGYFAMFFLQLYSGYTHYTMQFQEGFKSTERKMQACIVERAPIDPNEVAALENNYCIASHTH
jgi:hypothetical protein